MSLQVLPVCEGVEVIDRGDVPQGACLLAEAALGVHFAKAFEAKGVGVMGETARSSRSVWVQVGGSADSYVVLAKLRA